MILFFFSRYLKISEEERCLLETQRAHVTLGNTLLFKVNTRSSDDPPRDIARAERHHVTSLDLCERLGCDVSSEELVQMKARALLNLANVCEEKGQLVTAIEFQQRALNLFK